MKRFLVVLLILLLGKVSLAEDLSPVMQEKQTPAPITASIEFDWLDISQIDRDAVIAKYSTELFKDDTVYKYNKKEFRKDYKDFLKDSDYKRHYMLVTNDVKETNDENLCGFFRGNILISYAIQYKNDLKTAYYYDALGKLRYVDKFSENYPNFPYSSKQYRANGTLVSAIYFMSHDLQYMYNKDQSFKGAWYKDKMYDSRAKQVLKRNNW